MGFEPSHDIDLRRTKQRRAVEVVLARAEFLPEAERTLVRAVYADGKSVRSLSLLAGVSERVMARRVRRVVTRARAQAFELVTMRASGWPAARRRVGEAVYVRGHSQRACARELGLSIHSVWLHLGSIRALCAMGDS